MDRIYRTSRRLKVATRVTLILAGVLFTVPIVALFILKA